MTLVAILSVTAFGVVMLTVGFVCGTYVGKRQARIHALNQCIDWAALAMKGNPVWRRLTVADALLKAGTLIGGNDVMPRTSQPPRVVSRAPFTYESASTKGPRA